MRSVLKFIFNVVRNLCFVLVMLVLLITLSFELFPKSSQAFVEEITGTDFPPLEEHTDEEAGLIGVMSFPETADAGTRTPGNADVTITIGNSQSHMTFPAAEFVAATKTKKGSQNCIIYLEKDFNGTVRIGYNDLVRRLEAAGQDVFRSDEGVINLRHIRRYEKDTYGRLIAYTNDVCGGRPLMIPTAREQDFKAKMRKIANR